MYPSSRGSEFIDPCYPPIGRTSSYSNSISSNSSDLQTSNNSSGATIRTQKQHLIPAALNNLPLFCFPEGVQATYQRENERIHHVVFTQEEGKRTYALILTYQQKFVLRNVQPDEEGIYQIDDVKASIVTQRRRSVSRIPVPINSLKVDVPPTSSSSSPPTSPTTSSATRKPRSRVKPPTSLNPHGYQATQVRSNSSNDTNKQQPNYKKHTISSIQKSISQTDTAPPTRMIRRNSQTHLLSLTDTVSNPTLMRQRSVSIANRTQSINDEQRITSNDTSNPFYLPHCIVLIADQPYWTAMQETLSFIYDEIDRFKIDPCSVAYKQLIQRYAFLACNTPTPPIPIERFLLSFNLAYDQSILHFDPPIDANHTVLDLDLASLLLTINIGKLLDVLAVIFTQQPIIFFSSNYSTLVTTLECLLYLIYPLQWTHVYVPLVPDGLRDYYLEGPPGSYIMGTHSRNQEIVEDLNSSFTCNLDNDRNIHIPKNAQFHQIPVTKHNRFVSQITETIEHIKSTRSLQNTHTPVRLRINEQREFEHQQRIETNKEIIKIFLDLIVDLFGDTLQPIYWTVNAQKSPTSTLQKTNNGDGKNSSTGPTKKIFSKPKYLDSKAEGVELEFYTACVESTAFQLLIDEEMTSKVPTVFRQICQIHSSAHDELPHHDLVSLKQLAYNQVDLTSSFYDSMSSQMLLPLPSWPPNTTKHYLDSCIELFTHELRNAQKACSSTLIAIYAYLRGCVYVARGQYLEGLYDLYLIENENLFPIDYIENVVMPRLSYDSQLDLFLQESFYMNSPDWKKVHTRPASKHMSVIDLEKSGDSLDDTKTVKSATESNINNEWTVIETNLTFEKFSEYVHGLSILLDKETTETLFKALLYWTDTTLAKTLTREETSVPLSNKVSPTIKSRSRRGSFGGHAGSLLKDTIEMLTGAIGENQKPPLSSKSSATMATIPATLFELFLEIWQQTNVEKVRMNRFLPEDRQHKESILKISSSGILSKSDGPGQLILTQKRLYFLPEARSYARLFTELINIKSVEKYQHQTIFSSSKPGMKIFTLTSTSTNSSSLPRDQNSTLKAKSSTLEKEPKAAIRLIFNNIQEQQLWYTIIIEIWSGTTMAHEQCDTHVLNKASRHVAIMDTLSNMYYDVETMASTSKPSANAPEKHKRRHNEKCLEMALNDFAIVTRMRQTNLSKPLSDETRNVLTRRVSPSANEAERHPVRCLVFTKNPNNGYSSLWCAYGSKLKVFNVKTWICEPVDRLFPSAITCMCLDAQSKLWVGCLGGQLFVVDTITHVCGAQLASINGEGGCQTIVYDPIYDYILTANRSSSVTVWNALTRARLKDVNLYEIYKTTFYEQSKLFVSTVEVILRNETPSIKQSKDNRKGKIFNGTKQPINDMEIPNIPEASGPAQVIPSPTDRLKEIQIYDTLLFACYHNDYILVIRKSDANSYICEHIVSVKYKAGESTPIDSFIIYDNKLWISAGPIIHIFGAGNTNEKSSYELLMKKSVDDDRLTTMLGFSDYIWAGSYCGNIYLFRMDNYERHNTLAGHRDGVSCLCSMSDTFIISGSAENDTSIAIWDKVQISNDATKSLAVLLPSPTTKLSTTNGFADPNASKIKKKA